MTDKSAFPDVGGFYRDGIEVEAQPGMTFREWQWTQFAAAALTGMYAADTVDSVMSPQDKTEQALNIANSMMAAIAEREQDKDHE